MISKAQSKLLRSLKHKKYRQKYSLFVVEGEKSVLEVLKNPVAVPEFIIAVDEWIEKHQHILTSHNERVYSVTTDELNSLAIQQNPNQAICVVHQLPVPEWEELQRHPILLYLEKLQDPGNFGTIIRIADWFNHPAVLCSSDTVEFYNPKVIQAAMGSFLRVGVKSASVEEIQEKLPKHSLYASTMEGQSVYSSNCNFPAVVMIGNESSGLTDKATSVADGSISIPGNKEQQTDSLNAAVASGILCSVLDHRYRT